jgi:hypothetical protein
MLNKFRYYISRYWVTISFIVLAIYFYPTHTEITQCGPMILDSNNNHKTLFGLGEMSWMWLLMAVAHGANYCYCDIKKLIKK